MFPLHPLGGSRDCATRHKAALTGVNAAAQNVEVASVHVRHAIEPVEKGWQSMRADVTRIQLDMEKMRDTQYNLAERMGTIRTACAPGENG